MTHGELVEYLHAKAVRCRELGKSATDRDAAAALQQMAIDMETLIDVLSASDAEERQAS